MTISVNGTSLDLIEDILTFRKDLHENPELSGEEFETSKKIQEKLDQYGIPYQTGYAKTGVLGIIEGGKPGRTIALRADIDALPITEKTDLEFASKNPGKMHACGHDAHTAMLLGVGVALNQIKEGIEGTVLLVFQPAEENAPEGGAEQMMKDGVFDTYEPDVIIGQHVWPDLPVGQFGVMSGPIMGNSDRFKIVVRGAGGHASMPHQTIDAIVAANHIVTALQTVVSRNVDPLDSAVVTVGKIEGGYRYNVVADEVTLEGTVRTFQDETKQKVKERFHAIVKGVAEGMGAQVDIDYLDGYPATVNTPEWADLIKHTAQSMFGKESIPSLPPSMGGEDFGRFLVNYPGVYYWLGTSIGEVQKPLHDPAFQLNEEAIPLGIKLMTQAAIDTLSRLNQKDAGGNCK
ncbi:M20 family metallopeptidase [Alkalihalobacillus sp. AL-G]|uniref:M20 metallopeptidase family protein n=1 Tax=Alkalihalobacillus sp. AL-G TaxID=2926399 RepID=UPI00272B83F8|nr:M20 family metallopeptidase [Alkalihalobacillus sp. AL-G]WLD93590.1 M20 family metallopeptidase [Alkalihalobacillus sp. AL-G]